MTRAGWRYAMLAVILLLATVGLAAAGRWLVVDQPQRADVILVLEGEAGQRPLRGLSLLEQGYAPQMWIDADGQLREYQWTEADLARLWVRTLPPELAARIRVRQETDESTKLEARHTAAEMAAAGIHSVLLVTSDFHTRRALAEYRHEIPGVHFSAAAARNPREFGVNWWQKRQWTKRFVIESMSFAWWECADRWLPSH